jgi:GntR family transcriptional regulator, arabinose operon transcriptional repressor
METGVVFTMAKSEPPKYRRIHDHLRDAIVAGRYEPGQRLPSESALVRQFHASRLTVNRAFRELQIQGLIERRVGSGSYVRSHASQGYTFGLLIPELGRTEIFEPICRGMAEAPLSEHHVLLWGKTLAESRLDGARVGDACRQLIAKKVSGVFFAPLELTAEKDTLNRTIISLLAESGIPVVLLDRDLVMYPDRSPYDLVGIDNRRAGHVITCHLLQQGAQRIVFVARPRSAPTVDARIAGFRDALHRAGVAWRAEFVQRIDVANRSQVQHLLDDIAPDAILCANDYTCGQIMNTLEDLGAILPDEIKIAGFDDVKYASLLPVPLTTIHQPCGEMGRAALTAMIERLQSPDMPARDITLNVRLIVRESTTATVKEHR